MTTVFDNDSTTNDNPVEESNQEQNQSSVFNELVGEGKKFQSEEDLAKGKKEADAFIEQLKGEMQGLREELDKRMTSEDVLKEIEERTNKRNESETPTQISQKDLSSLIRDELSTAKQQEVQTLNLLKVDAMMKEKFGDKARQVLESKANELGVSTDFLKDAAAQSPNAYFNLIGIDGIKNNQDHSVTTGSVNTQTLPNVSSGPREGSYGYYEQLRKKDPRAYFSPEIQTKLFKDRQVLGDKFYN